MSVVRYFLRTYPLDTLVVTLCLVAATLFEGVGLAALLPLLGLATGSEPSGASSAFESATRGALQSVGIPVSLGWLLLVIVLAFVVKAGLTVLAKRQVGYTVAHVATDLRLSLLRALLAARWSYYTRQPVGLAANAMASEAERASMAYHHMVQSLAFSLQMLLYAGIALAVSWQATAAAAVAGLFTFWVLRALVTMAFRAGHRQTKLMRVLLSRLTDTLQAVKLLKATGREKLVAPLLSEETLKLNKALRRRVLSKEALRALQEPLLVIFAAGGLYVAIALWQVELKAVIMMVLLFTQTLGASNKVHRKYQSMLEESSGLWALLDMTGRARQEEEPLWGEVEPTLDRGVSLRGVSLAYDGRPVLQDLSLELPAGRITAVVGPSGAGKSTLVDLVTGLRRPDSGEIFVDDVPLAEVRLHRWREMLGYVPQESLMLNDSVRVNVTLGDPAVDDAQLDAALRDAGAWEFVSRLPQGVESSVGERGALLSGGQRQRLAIARALVHGTRLLILDEATAALDPESERAVWDTVAQLRGKRTVVAISHQPALMSIADRVYRIDEGTARRDESHQASREVA